MFWSTYSLTLYFKLRYRYEVNTVRSALTNVAILASQKRWHPVLRTLEGPKNQGALSVEYARFIAAIPKFQNEGHSGLPSGDV